MKYFIYSLLAFSLMACNTSKKSTTESVNAKEPFIIYKTKADYNNNVPIIMNDDKTAIIAYPAPEDLKGAEGMASPTLLDDGYLLDNRGITKNSVFTSYSYEVYAALESAPLLAELELSIIEKDPFLEIYNCKKHLHLKNKLNEINKLIKNGFVECQRIK